MGKAEFEREIYKQQLEAREPQVCGSMWPQMQEDTWTSYKDLICIMKAQERIAETKIWVSGQPNKCHQVHKITSTHYTLGDPSPLQEPYFSLMCMKTQFSSPQTICDGEEEWGGSSLSSSSSNSCHLQSRNLALSTTAFRSHHNHMGIAILPIRQMKKLILWEVKWFVQSHTADDVSGAGTKAFGNQRLHPQLSWREETAEHNGRQTPVFRKQPPGTW